MNHLESLLFLKKHRLIEQATNYAPAIKRMLGTAFGLNKGDILMIISDKGKNNNLCAPLLAATYYVASKRLGLNPNIHLDNSELANSHPSEEIQRALSMLPDKSVVLLALSDKLGTLSNIGHSFRNFCKIKQHRFATTSSLSFLPMNKFHYLIKAMDVDYVSLREKHLKLAKIMSCSNTIRLLSKNGTDLIADIKSSTAISSDGMYDKVGLGGNIPAGEVFIAPNRDNISGKVVIDGSSRTLHGVSLIKSKSDWITMRVKDGKVVAIEGGESASLLKQSLFEKAEKTKMPIWGINRIGEIGIGLNPNATIVGTTIIDEKVLGTAHVALGSNYWFMGRVVAPLHLDQVFRDAEIILDGKKIDVRNL